MVVAELAAAARLETDLCAQQLPRMVLSNKISAERAQVTFQAWSIIARWLETGRFESIASGGAKGDTWVGWAECDDVVQRAALKLRERVSDLAAAIAGETDAAKRAQLEAKGRAALERAVAVAAIARRVSDSRSTVDAINQGFAERRRSLEALKAA